MVQELEKAVELEPNKETYSLLQKAYTAIGMLAEADLAGDKIKKLIVPAGRPKRIVRPRRVVI